MGPSFLGKLFHKKYILYIENFLEKPDGAKNHDGQKGQEKELMLQKIYNNNSTELFDILTTLTLLLLLSI